MSNVNQLPVIAGVEITTDTEGRFNLNALHRASGLGSHKAPSQWMRTQQAKDLINLAESKTMQICIVSVEGRCGGTFAHENLAIEYAGWISAGFRWEVNQTFSDYKSGKLASIQDKELSRMEILQIAMESEKEKLALKGEVEELKPKAAFDDKVVVAPDAITVAQAAKTLGLGRNRLLAYLRQHGWVTRKNEPYQAKIEAGLLDVKLGSWDHPDHGLQQSVTALVTGKGLAKLAQQLETPDAA